MNLLTATNSRSLLLALAPLLLLMPLKTSTFGLGLQTSYHTNTRYNNNNNPNPDTYGREWARTGTGCYIRCYASKKNSIDFCLSPADSSLSSRVEKSLTRTLNGATNAAVRRILVERSWPTSPEVSSRGAMDQCPPNSANPVNTNPVPPILELSLSDRQLPPERAASAWEQVPCPPALAPADHPQKAPPRPRRLICEEGQEVSGEGVRGDAPRR